MIKLRPCPFCGGQAEPIRIGDRRCSTIIGCADCGCRHESCDEGPRAGVSWNRRAADQPDAAPARRGFRDATGRFVPEPPAEPPRLEAPHVPTHYILVKPWAVYVKEAAFFRRQGGLAQAWGREWRPVIAGSIEEARAIGEVRRGSRATDTAAAQPDAGRAYYETHEPPHCPTCGCWQEVQPDPVRRCYFKAFGTMQCVKPEGHDGDHVCGAAQPAAATVEYEQVGWQYKFPAVFGAWTWRDSPDPYNGCTKPLEARAIYVRVEASAADNSAEDPA